MIDADVNIRVRYAETDQMGVVYYGNYAAYCEVGRVEVMRKIGTTYKALEESGVMLPVIDYQVKYLKPALYDDLLRVRTIIKTLPRARITFDYEIYNEKGDLLNEASTTLVFIKKDSGRPCAAPDWFMDALRPYFDK
ncbi:acyl-CoA thioesterase [Flavobacteriales bacterium]|jgi:acyl-CoA thioester hydrolase|nr:acyl-CoA thioesterase [Flavobacteriales bacterium]